ncbi:MAG: Wzz/FepE/Etk N-terminal domain-containing protein [Bacillota bacterium]
MEEERYYDEYEIDLREYIMLLWNAKWFIIGVCIIAVIGAGLMSQFYLTPSYETEAVLQLSNIDNLYSNPEAVTQIIKSGSLVAPIMSDYNQKFSDAQLNNYIENNINVSLIGERQIRVSVRNNDPELTLNITEDLIDKFVARSEENFQRYINRQEKNIENLNKEIQNINNQINTIKAEINNLQNNDIKAAEKGILINEQVNLLNSLYNQKNNYQDRVQKLENEIFSLYSLEVLNEPYLPDNPVSPNTKLNVAIAGVLALMLGVFIVFFREFLKEDDEN